MGCKQLMGAARAVAVQLLMSRLNPVPPSGHVAYSMDCSIGNRKQAPLKHCASLKILTGTAWHSPSLVVPVDCMCCEQYCYNVTWLRHCQCEYVPTSAVAVMGLLAARGLVVLLLGVHCC